MTTLEISIPPFESGPYSRRSRLRASPPCYRKTGQNIRASLPANQCNSSHTNPEISHIIGNAKLSPQIKPEEARVSAAPPERSP